MKQICLLFMVLVVLVASFDANAEPRSVTVHLQNNFGYTVVDVADAMAIPEYSRIADEGLAASDQFNYNGLIQILFDQSEKFAYGPELGFNRLYYWEEKHIPRGLSPRWRWGTIWTGHVGGVVRLRFSPSYYAYAGAALHHFFNGSGTTIGIPMGIGREIRILEKFTIPVEFRTDLIFADATPIGFGGGIGLMLQLKK